MIVSIGADDPRLAQFHAGIYMDAFAAQQEPLVVWQRALRGELPYAMTVRLAIDGDAILGGICYELYPQSRCGFMTYMVVAPEARRSGLGERLFRDAVADLRARGAKAVLAEVVDPAKRSPNDAAMSVDAERVARFVRWGAHVVDVPYVQPSLAPGLPRDESLVLIAVGPAERTDIEAFIDELYTVCEGHTRQAAFTVSPAKSPG